MAEENRDEPRALDESIYKLDGADFDFISAATGITDPEELKQHIVAVQREIYAVRVQRLFCVVRSFDPCSRGLGPSLSLYPRFQLRKVSAVLVRS